MKKRGVWRHPQSNSSGELSPSVDCRSETYRNQVSGAPGRLGSWWVGHLAGATAGEECILAGDEVLS